MQIKCLFSWLHTIIWDHIQHTGRVVSLSSSRCLKKSSRNCHSLPKTNPISFPRYTESSAGHLTQCWGVIPTTSDWCYVRPPSPSQSHALWTKFILWETVFHFQGPILLPPQSLNLVNEVPLPVPLEKTWIMPSPQGNEGYGISTAKSNSIFWRKMKPLFYYKIQEVSIYFFPDHSNP